MQSYGFTNCKELALYDLVASGNHPITDVYENWNRMMNNHPTGPAIVIDPQYMAGITVFNADSLTLAGMSKHVSK